MQVSWDDRVFDIVTWAFLLFFIVIVMYPLYFVVIASFSDPMYVNNGQLVFLPKGISRISSLAPF